MSDHLTERILNVFVFDRNKRPVPGAEVTIGIDGSPVVSGTTKGEVGAPLIVQVPESVITVSVRVQYRPNIDKYFKVDLDQRSFNVFLEELVLPNPNPTVPQWFPVTGYVSGLATLLFFMYIALFQKGPPTFAHVIVISLGAALAFSFIGGDASAKGNLPIPFLNNSPLAVSLGGGVAVFVIVLVICWAAFLRKPDAVNPDSYSVSFDEEVPLSTAVGMLEKAKNVTVVFAQGCPPDAAKAVIAAGELRGKNPKEFLDNLQYRLRTPTFKYTVRATRERYEIVCQ